MKKFLIVVCALVGMMIVDVGAAQAFGGRRRATVIYAPTPSVAIAQGQAGAGYRTYSYQPSAGYQTYSYQPDTTYSRLSSGTPSGFHDAGWKVRGGF